MSTLNDVKLAALKTLTGETEGTSRDLELRWLKDVTGESEGTINDLAIQALSDAGHTSGTVNDRWYAYLGDEGYTGTLQDRLLQYWQAGGGFLAVPAQPTSLSATAASSSQIDLTWTDNADDETSYRVERSPNGTSGWSTVATIAADSTSHSDTGLDAETTYYYRVFAVNASGDSDASNTDSATTEAAVLVSDTFTDTVGVNLTAHTPDTDSVGGGWTAERGSIVIHTGGAFAKASSATDHIYSIETNESDADVTMDVRQTNVTQTYGGPALRITNADNLIFCQVDASEFKIYRRQGGSYVNMQSISVSNSTDWRTIRIKATGNVIEAWLNGANYITTTTSFNNTATKVGIRADRPAEFDNMTVVTSS